MALSSAQILALEWLHSLFQELEDMNVELPMGDYHYVYWIIESVRDGIEVAR